MALDIRSFSEIEKFIKENPRGADAQVFEWERFLKLNSASYPEILEIKTKEGFYKWVSDHPEKHVGPSVWDGKEISDYLYLKRQEEQDPQVKKKAKVTKENNEESPELDAESTPVNLQEKEESSSGVNISDVNRLIEEVSDFEKKSIPETPTNIISESPGGPSFVGESAENFGQEASQLGQLAQRGLTNTGRVVPKIAPQAGRIVIQAGRAAVQFGARFGAFLISPPGLILLAIFIITGATLIIVLSLGAPPPGTGLNAPQVTLPNPTLAPPVGP